MMVVKLQKIRKCLQIAENNINRKLDLKKNLQCTIEKKFVLESSKTAGFIILK